MPFVPLGQRKATPLILDDDKARIQAKQQHKDRSTLDAHYGVAAGASGYRFANHPVTLRGQIRGPDVPFRNATAPWRPPSADSSGPANRAAKEQASYGANWENSHGMRASRSSPALIKKTSIVNVMEACHPLSVELGRWKEMGIKNELELRKDIELKCPEVEHYPEPPKLGRRGLVLFPKYHHMFISDKIHECNLKLTDLQRFQRQQQEEVQRALQEQAEQQALQIEASQDTLTSSMAAPSDMEIMMSQSMRDRGPIKFEASWGSPTLRKGGGQWAGNGMPAGSIHKTSNPFRTG